MFLRSLVYCVLTITALIGAVDGDNCLYRDSFGNRRNRTCSTGCCGDINNSYCCVHKHLGAIVLGTVVGVFVVIIIIVVILHCYFQRRRNRIEYRRVTRNYGTISVPDPAVQVYNSNFVTPEIGISVTPATPEKSYLEPLQYETTHKVDIIVGSATDNSEEETEPRISSVTFVEEPEIIEPKASVNSEDIMGNENRPAGRVEDDVQPYRPNKPAGAVDTEAYYPDNRPYPDNQPYRPDLEPYQPNNQPDLQPFGQPAGVAGPDLQPHYPDNKPYGSDTTPYPSGDLNAHNLDTDPYPSNDKQPFNDLQPYSSEPAGFAGGNEAFQPDDQPYRGDTEPFGDDNQPY